LGDAGLQLLVYSGREDEKNRNYAMLIKLLTILLLPVILLLAIVADILGVKIAEG
jgi:hypothetical protein